MDRVHPIFLVVAQSANSRVLRGLALNGSGVAWLPECCVREDLHHGTLVHAGGEQWNSNIEIRLYASPERTKLLEFNLWENIRDWQEASLATT